MRPSSASCRKVYFNIEWRSELTEVGWRQARGARVVPGEGSIARVVTLAEQQGSSHPEFMPRRSQGEPAPYPTHSFRHMQFILSDERNQI